ncbi:MULTISPECIES: DUF5362 family protein [Bacillus cereus group]|uniref:Zn-finger protein n=1 Tax=Bacillus thuringiensis TaxID=1428 RepID=A0A1C4FX31_BACTU|nr:MULTISPECIES: DUF5362 family protein [Bacillus cereus group]MED3022316.1 DUF5362 family protein [Bacillus wiedmannii]OTX94419.1 hypothetical protein BK729_29585 [Bacillus thuringiensis serovar wratislaviensis]OUB56181.1 hypothetical protein BK743_20985 [Bacillus thuringiensis serovar sylvestriensis]SCC60424.1 Zn-finger protein [Bacillus thuringiensis]
MDLRTTADGNSYIIEVEMKKASKKGILARLGSLSIGVFLIVCGIILCLSIIGAIPGILLIVGGLPFIYLSLGFQLVKCPNCNKKQKIKKGGDHFICERCNKTTLIEWKK